MSDRQREDLISAQSRIHRLLRLAAVTVRETGADAPDSRQCLRAYAAELAVRFPEGYDDSALTAPAGLAGDEGALLVAYEEDRPVGCGAWCRIGAATAEIRHLWVAAEARGLGLGHRLLNAVESAAAAHGATTVRLGTHTVLTEAAALYRSAGYHEIAPYDGSPYNQLAFEKRLPTDPEISSAG